MKKKKMTTKDLVEKLDALSEGNDPEWDHEQADQLLLDFIDDPEVTNAFYSIRKWYA